MRIISKNKIEELKITMEKKKADAVILLNYAPVHDSSIEYLTGFRQERNQSFSCLIMGRRKSVLVVSALDYDQACREAEADKIIMIKKARLGEIIRENVPKHWRIGICSSLMPVSMLGILGKNTIEMEHDILSLRSIKEKREIELIEKSCSIANRGIKFLDKNIASFRTGKEISIELESFLLKNGADEIAFPTLVTSGKRGLYVHPYPSSSKDRLGNVGLVDFGVRVGGYCSDVTVPFVKGSISSEQKKIISTVKEAYSSAVAHLESGAKAHEVFNVAEYVISGKGFEFKHSLGHGIGLDVHEYPNLSQKPTDKKVLKKWKETELKENMVFTIEPGVYESSCGFRIENDFLMTSKGPKQLTGAGIINI